MGLPPFLTPPYTDIPTIYWALSFQSLLRLDANIPSFRSRECSFRTFLVCLTDDVYHYIDPFRFADIEELVCFLPILELYGLIVPGEGVVAIQL